MAEMAPWKDPYPPSHGLSFERVATSGISQQAQGGATHYAFDAKRDGTTIARIVIADTSMGSIAASDPQQDPIEPGGQLAWLDSVLSSRPQGAKAIVVSNTPTYTYAPISPTETQTDAAAFETIMLKDKVNVVVSGHLGWNGVYWALGAGGVPINHAPAPGGAYTDKTPAALPGGDRPIPFVVSSSAGGKFNAGAEQAGQATAANGFWRGYSVVHVAPDGGVSVEQRPVLDWIGVRGDKRVLRAGQKTTIVGYGREPFGIDQPERFYDIPTTPAVTHRWALVLADPQKPWMPKVDQHSTYDNHYVPAPDNLGTIDDQTGEVKAVGGVSSRTYALAILSVGAHVATYPLVFEPRPGFNAEIAPSSPPPLAASSPPAPPPPPNSSGGFTLPPTPALPAIPPLAAQPPLAPPAPPLPPNSSAANLTLFTSPPVLSVAPSVSLFPPSAPVINVAPPTPARPIEKARKVAVQSSGSDNTDNKSNTAVDLADGPRAKASFTRHDPNAFTALSHHDQASAWARDLQWGGGLTLAALVLMFGWVTVRPTPRRRMPEVPAPAWARRRR